MNIIELYNAPLLTRDSANGSEIAQGVQRLGYGLGLILGGRRDFSRLHSVYSGHRGPLNLIFTGYRVLLCPFLIFLSHRHW